MDFRNKDYIEKFSKIENTINSSDLNEYEKVTLLKDIEYLVNQELRTIRNTIENAFTKNWSMDALDKKWHTIQSIAFNNTFEN